MVKKVIFSAKLNHDVIKGLVQKLKDINNVNFVFHDPTKDFLDLEDISNSFGDSDLIIVKVRNECSIDLLHFAKTNEIPALHDVSTVLMCTNKVALDHSLRNAFGKHPEEVKNFSLPKSWTQSVLKLDKFKEWAADKLPIVIKSHYQHDKYMRFNFLVEELSHVEDFCERYKNFLHYNVYVQKFVESDGIERKIYVIGDKVYGIQRENPIHIFLREKVDRLDVRKIEREEFEPSEEIKQFSKILSKELNLKIFGFDLLKPIDDDNYILVDLNDFPGFRGIINIENELFSFFKEYIGF